MPEETLWSARLLKVAPAQQLHTLALDDTRAGKHTMPRCCVLRHFWAHGTRGRSKSCAIINTHPTAHWRAAGAANLSTT